MMSRKTMYKPTPSTPYSPSIAQELLNGTNEWINIQDIVKLTFKALFDVVKAQGDAIRDLEETMPTKSSKAEVNAGLSQKASISELSKSLAEIAANVESRATVQELQNALSDKADKDELKKILADCAPKDDLLTLMKDKTTLESEVARISSGIDNLQHELVTKLSTESVTKQFSELKTAIDQKASMAEVNDALQKKASKDSVAAALQKKAGVKELEVALSKKIDMADLQKLLAAVERKVDSNDLVVLQKQIDLKLSELEMLGKEVQQKTTAKDLDVAISSLAEVQRMEREKTEIELEKRVNDLHKIVQDNFELLQKTTAKRNEFDDIRVQLEKKKDGIEFRKEHEALKIQVDELAQKLGEGVEAELTRVASAADEAQEEVRRLKDQSRVAAEERRKDCDDTSKYFATLSNNVKEQIEDEQKAMYKEISGVRKEIELLSQKTCDRKELALLKSSLQRALEPKADIGEVQQAITESQTLVAKRIAEFKEEVKKDVAMVKEDVSKKANVDYVNAALNGKVEQSMLVAAIQEKANLSEFETLVSKVSAIQTDNSKKLDRREFETHESEEKDQMAEMKKELLLKANIKDVCTLVDIKANAEDVKKGITELHLQLDKKTNSEDFASAMADQSLINEALCAENCVGRWVWKSGSLRNGYAVPWEAQSVNTCPDNFLWEKDKTSIMMVAAGLYEIKLGFFAAKISNVQVLVNGEPVLSPAKPSRQIDCRNDIQFSCCCTQYHQVQGNSKVVRWKFHRYHKPQTVRMDVGGLFGFATEDENIHFLQRRR